MDIFKIRVTCCDHLVDARCLLEADGVGPPAGEGTVVHLGHGGVVESGDGSGGCVAGRRNLGLLSTVVEGPLEGDKGWVSIDLALEGHCLLLEGAVQLLLFLLAGGDV